MLTALAFLQNTVRGLDRIVESRAPVTTIRAPTITGLRSFHFATSLEAFEEVLMRRDYKTVTVGPYYDYLLKNYGPWLLSSNAEQHKSYTPYKHFSNADDFGDYLRGLFAFLERRVARWPAVSDGNVDTTELFHSVAFYAVVGLLFSNAIGFQDGDEESAAERARRQLVRRAWDFTGHDMEFFSRTTISLKWRYNRRYEELRSACFAEWDAMLASLGPDEPRYAARLRSAGFIAPDFIRTTMQAGLMFIPSFLVRGLQYALITLAANPAVADGLRADIAAATPESCSPKHADQTPHLDQFVKELLRLFPAFYILDRRATEDQDLLGTRVRKGEQIFLSPYVLHRDPTLWPEPLVFRPERFAGPKPKGYYPFGLGPHMCAGQAFAPGLFKGLLVAILRRSRFTPLHVPRIAGGIPGLRFEREPRFAISPAPASVAS